MQISCPRRIFYSVQSVTGFVTYCGTHPGFIFLFIFINQLSFPHDRQYPFHIFLSSPTFTLSSSPGGPSGGGADGVRRTRGSSLRFLRLIRSSDVVDLGSWVSTSVLDPARFIQPTFCLTMMSVLKLSSVCFSSYYNR